MTSPPPTEPNKQSTSGETPSSKTLKFCKIPNCQNPATAHGPCAKQREQILSGQSHGHAIAAAGTTGPPNEQPVEAQGPAPYGHAITAAGQ
jgi:hypothetical protein